MPDVARRSLAGGAPALPVLQTHRIPLDNLVEKASACNASAPPEDYATHSTLSWCSATAPAVSVSRAWAALGLLEQLSWCRVHLYDGLMVRPG